MSPMYDIEPEWVGSRGLAMGDLAAAMERAGALPLEKSAELLLARWQGMAEDEALADADALIEQILKILDSHAMSATTRGQADAHNARHGQRLGALLSARTRAA